VSTVTGSPHPDGATLHAFRCGRLTGAARDAVAEHLAWCARCSGELTDEVPSVDVPPPLVDHPRYRVLAQIGAGGMGVVYRAEHRVMGRTVALKVLSTGVTATPTAVDRFRREVRLASRLNHPHIVTAYDADEAGGLHFLVMEFVEGTSLDKYVRERGRLPVAVACACIHQAALGLQHAHEKGMIHRDIKPHNLMLTGSGQVKILDFGLARVASADSADPMSVTAQAITQPQMLLGTPDYLSPEQARGAPLDLRTDIYSLGCTLYFLLTGTPPYGGNGPYAKMIAHAKESIPDVTAARSDVPAELAAVLRKMMAKSPDDRYQSAADVAAALSPFAPALEAASGARSAHRSTGAGTDTVSNTATDDLTAALPLAAEYEPERALTAESEAQEPTAPAKRGVGLFALGAAVLVGLAAAGVAVYLSKSNKPAEHEPADHTKAGDPKPPNTGPGPAPAPPVAVAPMPHVRKWRVMLLVPPDFTASEFETVTESLKRHGATTVVVGPDTKTLEGIRLTPEGRTVLRTLDPELGVKDVTDAVIDSVDAAIALPGRDPAAFAAKGPAAAEFARIIKKLVQQKKVVGAIAASGIIELGTHGFLEQVEVSAPPATARPIAIEKLKVKQWVKDPKVVVDFPFVTSGELGHGRTLTDEVIKTLLAHHPR
jgi:hypothetical protein